MVDICDSEYLTAEMSTENILISKKDLEDEDIFISRIKSTRKAAILSDDEDGTIDTINDNNTSNYSDSEEEDRSRPRLKNINLNSESTSSKSLKSQRNRLVQMEDSDDDLSIKNLENVESDNTCKTIPKYEYKNGIFDTETSDDEQGYRPSPSPINNSESENSHHNKMSPKKSFKKKKKDGDIDRKNEKLEIYRESQKRIRETDICLPYHKPKQRTLTEFLNRNKSSVPSDKRRSLKMSMKDETLLREIEERKKEVDTFYKSDSDDEDYLPEEIDLDNNAILAKDEESKVGKESDIDKEEPYVYESNIIFKEIVDTNSKDLLLEENINVKIDAEDIINGEQTSLNPSNKIATNTCENVIILETEEDSKKVKVPIVEGKSMDWVDLNNDFQKEDFSCLPMCLQDSEMNEILADSNDNTENFRLRLDTEDIDESDKGTKSPLNFTLELRKANNNSKNKVDIDCSNSLNKMTPKMQFLATQFPKDFAKIALTTPKISNKGNGDFVNLDDYCDSMTPKLEVGATLLINRFVKHSNTKRKPADAQEVSMNIVSKEKSFSGEEKLVSSEITVNINAEEVTHNEETVPGERLGRLKRKLKAQLIQQREKDRQRREKEKKFMDSEEVIQDFTDGLLDEEKELTDGSDSEYETESEPEENDIVIQDKKRKKNKFLDEEAEESADDDLSDKDLENERSLNEYSRLDILNDESEDSLKPKCTKSKRVTKTTDDIGEKSVFLNYEHESDNDIQSLKLLWSESINEDGKASRSILSRTSTDDLFGSQTEENAHKKVPMDSSFELVGSVIPGYQPGGGTEEIKKHDSFFEDDTYGLSMLSRLDNLRESISTDDNDIPKKTFNLLLTPLKTSQTTAKNVCSAKKSFPLNFPEMDHLENQDQHELLALCSGQFTDQSADKSDLKKVGDLCKEEGYPPTQDLNDLVDLCSGKFQTQKNHGKSLFCEQYASSPVAEKSDTKPIVDIYDDQDYPPTQDINDLVDLCSGKFFTQKNKEEESSEDICLSKSPNSSGNKLNFVSLKKSSTSRSYDNLNRNTSPAPKIDTPSMSQEDVASKIVSPKPQLDIFSSDEEGIERRHVLKKKKRRRIVALSDDEGLDTDDSLSSLTDENVEYDEDELPIVQEKFSGFKDGIKGGIRSDFLDKEAELSGSEEGSEDEFEPDEDDDIMEQEAGDLDRFDEEQLRDEVGKAHLKSMIDKDKRELRILQELYFEDGDLHGQGRQRKFRWQHLNATEDTEGKKSDDDEIEEDELVLEEESEWRKQRFEREKFIRDKKESKSDVPISPDKIAEDIEEPVNSSFLKLVRTLSNRSSSLQSSNSVPLQNSLLPVLNLSSSSKRGSFLKRDSSTLKKLAEFTKENQTIGAAKQGGNFVFQTLTAEEIEKKTKDAEKRKANLEKPQPKKCRHERSFFSLDPGSQNRSIFKHL